MGLQRFQPTARQELVGRAALVVFGLLLIGAAALTAWFCFKHAIAFAEAESGPGVQLCLPLLVVSAALLLVGLAAVVFAFIPTADKGRGPPRGFATLSRVFDAFGVAVGAAVDD